MKPTEPKFPAPYFAIHNRLQQAILLIDEALDIANTKRPQTEITILFQRISDELKFRSREAKAQLEACVKVIDLPQSSERGRLLIHNPEKLEDPEFLEAVMGQGHVLEDMRRDLKRLRNKVEG